MAYTVSAVSWANVLLVFGDAGLELIGVGATLLLVGAEVLVTLNASRNHTTITGVVDNIAASMVLDKCVFLRSRTVMCIRTLKDAIEAGCCT